jgi:hypothetical protein
MKLLAEISLYAAFVLFIAVLSAWPPYQLMADDRAIISLVFSHAGQRIGECRTLSQEELNELPPNMRKPNDCPRERHPVRIEFRTDTTVLYRETLPPSGIWADGKSNVYQRIEVQSGMHELFIGMNDSGSSDVFDYSTSAAINLLPGKNLVIQFDDETQQFSIR